MHVRRWRLRWGVGRSVALLPILWSAGMGKVVAQSTAPPDCPFSVPADAAAFVGADPQRLAGDYRLIRISWQPSAQVIRGRLHLQVPDLDSLPPWDRSKPPALAGWYQRDTLGKRTGTRLRPQLELCETSTMGWDGMGDCFLITASSPNGFWGIWHTDYGIGVRVVGGRRIPNPAGFFCALRETN